MEMEVRLPRCLAAKIEAHGQRAYPEECCGLLIGRLGDTLINVTAIRATENLHAGGREYRYSIAPQSYLEAERWAEARGLEVVGFYHSHPDSSSQPSSFDVEAAWPHMLYLIVSIRRKRPGDMRVFHRRRSGNALIALHLMIED